ncbi:MAG: Rieske 2Fe-2S domain-containing protein [Acidimicrobiales bacterium]
MTDTTEAGRSDARHPGPSTPDLLRADPSGVPPVWLTESMPHLGAAPVPFEHYTSAERAELEQDHLWGRVWQWACHETHVPDVGDYHVYDIGDRSAIIVRTDAGLRGFLNVCQHRGTQLKPPGSCGFTAQHVVILAPAPADGERPQPPEPVHLGVDDSFTSVAGVSKSIGIVLDQDTANLAAQARGMRAAVRDGRTTGESLGVYQEARIRHFHATIEQYIQRGLASSG